VAFAFVLQVLPQFFIAPAAGVVNDRLSRKRVMIFADLVRAVVVFFMLFAQSRDLVPVIYGLLFAETLMWGFFEPARSAVIPNITREGQMLVANTLSSTTWSFNLAVGSAVGGVVAVVFGRNTVFAINTLSFLVSAYLLRRMRFEEPHTASAPPMRVRDLTDFSPIAEGLRYVAGDSRLLATLLVKAGLGFMGTNWVILPILGERDFPVSLGRLDPQRAGMLGMSLLMGARGVGALLGPLISARWAGQMESRLRLGILFGFVAGVIGYLSLGASASMQMAFLAVVIAHAGGSTIWVFSTTLLQTHTEDRFRGRVFSADYAFLVLTMSLVSYVAGQLIDLGISPRQLATMTGVFGLLPLCVWAFALRLWKEPVVREKGGDGRKGQTPIS
jgi:MFS family permease